MQWRQNPSFDFAFCPFKSIKLAAVATSNPRDFQRTFFWRQKTRPAYYCLSCGLKSIGPIDQNKVPQKISGSWYPITEYWWKVNWNDNVNEREWYLPGWDWIMDEFTLGVRKILCDIGYRKRDIVCLRPETLFCEVWMNKTDFRSGLVLEATSRSSVDPVFLCSEYTTQEPVKCPDKQIYKYIWKLLDWTKVAW